MTAQDERARRFRALHEGPGAFVLPNPWDAGSARLLADLGFPALATTSAGMAFALGRGDGEVSRDEALDHARRIVTATDLPVSADLENCFADDPEGVVATIRGAAAAGLAGCSIEDHTNDAGKPIYDFGQSVERVAAAAETARGFAHDFVLTARAENFLHGRPDLDDTIRRLQAYEKAGADVLYAPGLPDLDAIRAVCSAVSRPVNVLMSGTFSVAELAAAGARRISTGSFLARVALGALLRAGREMREAGSFSFAADAVPSADLAAVFARFERGGR